MKSLTEQLRERRKAKNANRLQPGVHDLGDGKHDMHVSRHGVFKKKKFQPIVEVFKLQRPMATNDPEPKMLVYNQTRSWQGEIALNQDMYNFFGDSYKKYVRAYIDEQGRLNIVEGITNQDW